MPDISMCKGEDCPQKETCYRHKARPSEWQSWEPFDLARERGEGCNQYWPISKLQSFVPPKRQDTSR